MMSSFSRSLLPRNAVHKAQRVYFSFLSSQDPRSPSRSTPFPRNIFTSSWALNALRKNNPMPIESKEYWEGMLEIVESPVALKLKSQLDLDDVTGLQKNLKKSPPCLEFHTSIKKRFPEKIVLVQVGDFYESCGHDAVLMVSECGLNPMNLDSKTPRAGCPIRMLPNILKKLVHETNLSVVVCDEIKEAPGTFKKNQRKQRKVTQIYNPGEQGFDEVLANQLITGGGAGCMIGLIWDADGYGTLEFRLDRMSIEVTQTLTEDALWGLLSARNITAPISVHTDFTQALPDWRRSLKKLISGVSVGAHYLRAEDPVLEFRQFIKQHYGYSEEQEILIKEQDLQNRRRSPSFSTASQIGLTGLLGIPNILDFLTPKDSPVAIKAWFRDLLLNPKSMQTSKAIQSSLGHLEVLGDSLPGLRTDMSPEKVAKTLDNEATSVEFCRSLNELFSDVQSMFTSEALQNLTESILPVIEEEQSIQLDSHSFQDFCIKLQNRIQEIIILDPENRPEEDDLRTGLRDRQPKRILEDLFNFHENFDDIIQQKYITEELNAVEASKESLINAVFDSLDSVQSLAREFGWQINLALDDRKENLCIEGPNSLLKHPDFQALGLMDRTNSKNNKKISRRRRYSTDALDEVFYDYLRCTEAVKSQIQSILNTLGEDFKRKRSFLIATCQFCLTLQALIHHSWSSQGKSWKLPIISRALTPVENRTPGLLEVLGMWPYWMEKEAESTVKNGLELEGMAMLTGPNMAGKSTNLRSVVACTLLALSGLYVPAESMDCPYIDNVVLRSFSGDNPLAKLSGLANELHEVKIICDQATEYSFICLDEFGKSTEVRTGAGIAGSLLEVFASLKKCKGIFSTHLHLMKEMDLDLTNVTFMKMDTIEVAIDVKEEDSNSSPKFKQAPTWTISKGYNPQTLAIEVARDCGIKEEIVNQAFEFQKYLIENKDVLKHKKWSFTPILKKQEDINLVPQPLLANGVEERIQNGIKRNDDSAKDKTNGKVQDYGLIQILLSVCQDHGILHTETSPIKVLYVKSGRQPPPITVQRSCVYLLRRKSGHHKAGETDNLKTRLKNHESRRDLTPEMSTEFDAWYVIIPKSTGAKSMCRAIERDVTNVLVKEGRLMQSSGDLNNKNFGIRE